MAKKPTKQTSPKVSSLASGVLAGRIKPTQAQVKSLAATALGQDETKGQKRR
ncbi:hypothetical protein [Parasphingorhabdus sp.]|uniref:hypothetical protein n=1 Tax=Parasphingorhabdus sp. TaxID=2709688 RepID=UPI003A8CDBF6